jgi:hypothetical protein
MMASLRLALVCALGVLLLAPQPAAGGGWWTYIDPDRTTVAAGERVEVHELVMFRTIAEAQEASVAGQFYVYLLQGFDYSVVHQAMVSRSPQNWWSLGDAEAIQLAPVTISAKDANLASATASFTVPDLPAGSYHLMLCDAGCQEPLADVIPAEGFTIVADPATAQLSERADALQRQIRQQAGDLTDELAAVERGTHRATDAAAENIRSTEALDARVSSLENEGRHSPPGVYAGWFIAGALVGTLTMLVVRRRRARAPRDGGAAEWDPSDEELRELLSSEPAQRR